MTDSVHPRPKALEKPLDKAMTVRNECDLGVKLYSSRWTFSHTLGSQTILYSPDSDGMPILASDPVYDLYRMFSDGAVAGEALGLWLQEGGGAFLDGVNAIKTLIEKGFLRDKPDPEKFSRISYTPSKRALNVWLHINNNCNLDCSYCFVKNSTDQISDKVIGETVSRLVATVKKHGVNDILVKYAGGEPTMALPKMRKFHDLLTEKLDGAGVYLHWAILTNGTIITKKLLDFIKSSKSTVSVSIDGYGENHDIYRVYRAQNKNGEGKKGSWKEVIKNIDLLISNGINPYINAMVGPDTMSGLPKMAEWIFQNGLMGTIHVVRNVGDSWEKGESRKKEYSEYCDGLKNAFEEMLKIFELPEYRIKLPRWIEIAELYFNTPAPSICCGIGSDHLVIRHDGILASCPMTVNEQTVTPSDDLFESIATTFNKDEFPHIDEECLACRWYRVCACACPVANQRIKGHPFSKSPLCSFWRYVIPRYLVFYGKKLLQAEESGVGSFRGDFESRTI